MPARTRFKLILKHFLPVRSEDFSPFEPVRSEDFSPFQHCLTVLRELNG